jgi:hypothetical protein
MSKSLKSLVFLGMPSGGIPYASLVYRIPATGIWYARPPSWDKRTPLVETPYPLVGMVHPLVGQACQPPQRTGR